MNIPISLGMMRSGSRVAWQVVRELTPVSVRPPDYIVPEWEGTPQLDEVWPIRSHGYVSTLPCLFTYRHPIEAFLSLQAKFKLDIGKSNIREGYDLQHAWMGAMKRTGEAWDIWKRLKQEQASGWRSVLFLRYEDYYDAPEKRVQDIAEFMGVELSDEKLAEILDTTSLQSNFKKGVAMAHFHRDKGFSGMSGVESHMQQLHVSKETMGQPGKWIETQEAFYDEVRRGSQQPALIALKEMCESMGYEL